MSYRFVRLTALACAVVLAMALIGCGNGNQKAESTQQQKVEDTIITPYEFTHADRSIWFRLGNGENNKYDQISKDAVAYLFVFENGKLTYRSNWNTQLGDVCDMSDDEIIAMYKEGDEKMKTEAFEQGNASKTTEDKFYELLSPWDISAFTLSTDASGNNPVGEEIAFYDVGDKLSGMSITGAQVYISQDVDWKLELSNPDETASPIYDSYFGGYTLHEQSHWNMPFVTKVEDPQHTTFAFDPVGTDGVDAR